MTAPRVKLDIDGTRERLAALGLGHAVDALEGLLAEAVRAEMPAHVFLDRLLEAERSGREERRIRTMLKTSKIPTGQTLENFERSSRQSSGRGSRRSPPAPGSETPR
jgi:DNA replication protein DnaC